jgi:hypothetical protein
LRQTKLIVSEARGYFGKQEEGVRPPLEDVTRELVETLTEVTSVCVCVCVCKKIDL